MSIFTGAYVYRLVLAASLYGKACDNVFYYGVVGGSPSAINLRNAFGEDVAPAIQAIQSEDVLYASINSVGVQGIFDFDDYPFTAVGSVGDFAEPTFVAWGYRYNRAASNERHGYKRFAGVADTWWEGGEIDPANNTALAAVATVLEGDINNGGSTFTPLIQRRFLDKVPVDPPEYYTFNTVSFQGITTQNSRK